MQRMLFWFFAREEVKYHANITGAEAQILMSDKREFTKNN